MNTLTRIPHLTITQTFDRAFEVRGHCCNKTRSAVLFTIAHAATEGGVTLAVYTRLSATEFFTIARDVYPNTLRDDDIIFGDVLGSPWKVKIYELAC
jgi:hypothetical protein